MLHSQTCKAFILCLIAGSSLAVGRMPSRAQSPIVIKAKPQSTDTSKTKNTLMVTTIIGSLVKPVPSAPVSFNNDVVPILTRAGCNSGSCHGAQYGKGGYKLSLAGFDTDLDYMNTVKQAKSRRISVADPEHSLMILKPILSVPHGGGRRMDAGSLEYRTLVRWLREGAAGPNPADPVVTKIEVTPSERILGQPGDNLLLSIRATYSDGTKRDVTSRARINSLNDAVASSTPEGKVTAVNHGQTAIMIRYSGQAAVSTIIVPFLPMRVATREEAHTGRYARRGKRLAVSSATRHTPNVEVKFPKHRSGPTPYTLHPTPDTENPTPDTRHPNSIDSLVSRKQQQLGLAASPLCDDATFLRRISFDLIGTAPTPDELRSFLADKSPDKREKLVDSLLARPEFTDFWTLKWGDLLRSNRTNLTPKGMWSFTNWIHDQIQQNRPVDQMVHDLILAQGSTFTNGPSNYYRVAANPQDLAETTSQVFLGVRLQCARCHHHPFEKWSQTDYYQFAAYFARVGQKSSSDFGIFGNENVVKIQNGGEVTHPKTGKVMRPTPLGAPVLASLTNTKLPDPDIDGDRRIPLADWLTSKNNRIFAANIANRYWGYMFGKGIVNPIDDQRVTNPPTNPELLNYLTDELISSKYDLKYLLRVICISKTYQRSSEATAQNNCDELFFTHYYVRRLPAESLLDAIDYVCGTREKYQDLPLGTHAIQLPDPVVNNDFLDTFGRPQRLIACECERVAEPNLSQTLRLMNGYSVNNKVADGNGRIASLIKTKKSDDAIVKELYLASLGRLPGARERNLILGALVFTPDNKRQQLFEDVLLTLLNSKEFLLNH